MPDEADQILEDIFNETIQSTTNDDLKYFDKLPLLRVAGVDCFSRPIIVLIPCYVERNEYCLSKAICYICKCIDTIVKHYENITDYIIIYCHTKTLWTDTAFGWISQLYTSFPKRYINALKIIYILHPTNTLMALFSTYQRIFTSTIWKKIRYVERISDLNYLIRPGNINEFMKYFPYIVQYTDAEFCDYDLPSYFGVSLNHQCKYYTYPYKDYINIPEILAKILEYLNDPIILKSYKIFNQYSNDPTDIYDMVNQFENCRIFPKFPNPNVAITILKTWLGSLPEGGLLYDISINNINISDICIAISYNDITKYTIYSILELLYNGYIFRKKNDHTLNEIIDAFVGYFFRKPCINNKDIQNMIINIPKYKKIMSYLIKNYKSLNDDSKIKSQILSDTKKKSQILSDKNKSETSSSDSSKNSSNSSEAGSGDEGGSSDDSSSEPNSEIESVNDKKSTKNEKIARTIKQPIRLMSSENNSSDNSSDDLVESNPKIKSSIMPTIVTTPPPVNSNSQKPTVNSNTSINSKSTGSKVSKESKKDSLFDEINAIKSRK
eukprot:GHVL01037816.1.p1 GENE.GHVL01037816.1~~GHVL01037816.1.p1  ORF type:complete len:552 (+),score=150.13 GHVL01037816.1:36-1691(+)